MYGNNLWYGAIIKSDHWQNTMRNLCCTSKAYTKEYTIAIRPLLLIMIAARFQFYLHMLEPVAPILHILCM